MGSNKDLVGSVFKNKAGNSCKVLQVDGVYRTGHFKYIIECAVCSKDKELWPEGSIHSKKFLILEGNSGCGCLKGVRWSKRQYKILVERKCKLLGFEFKGFLEESDKITNKSYLSLYNPVTLNTWNTTTIASFLSGKRGDTDPYHRRERQKVLGSLIFLENVDIPDDKEVTFVGNKKDGCTWKFKCKTCEKDIISNTLGLQHATFKITPSGIRKMVYPCRCRERYFWSGEEREVILKNTLQEEGYCWIGWRGTYKNNHSKFKWECENGHCCETSVRDFLKNNVRCGACAKYGFSDGQEGIFYLVKWEVGSEVFLKYGIANTYLSQRKVCQKSKIKNNTEVSSENILIFKSRFGGEVKDIEKSVKGVLGGCFVTKEIFPDGYTETLPYTEDNILTIKSIVKKYINNLDTTKKLCDN